MKIGVFICYCGNNISATVDVEQVAKFALTLPDVVHSETIHHVCSEPGQNTIKQAIKNKGLDRIVIGACSPRIHEATFQRMVSAARLNKYMLEIANLREHCSWIHEDRSLATIKAIDLVNMAVCKVSRHKVLYPSQVEINPRTLVIGGGIAGIQAALDVAESGNEVVLVEREPSIGGNMARLDKVFPTLDCSGCILAPKMVDVANNKHISLHTYSEIEKVTGFVGNFKVTIRKKARLIDTAKCTGCGACTLKCPIKAPSEFNLGLDSRGAIYIPFPQAVPHIPVIDKTICPMVLKGKCGLCQKMCPTQAIDYKQEDTLIEESFGAIIVATGYELVDWKKLYGEYGHGRYPNVISSMQYERLLSASGPTGGHVILPSDFKKPHAEQREPKIIAFVACVGSRDEKVGRPYCSGVCCMYTAKYAMLTKEHIPAAEVYIFYMDLRAAGKSYEEFVRRAQEKYGARYIRGRVSKIYERNGRMVIMSADTLLGKQVQLEADLVVLAAGVASSSGANQLAQKLNISHDQYGFFIESHPKLRPVEASTAGIFICGACQGPKDIPLSVAQASSAAAKVLGLISHEKLETSPLVAEVNINRCIGCFRCLEVCPFTAIEKQEMRGGAWVARVNPALCQGCGLCNATCLPGAISLNGFTDDQILSEVEAICLVNPEL
ncbi:MAG: CoB--CoM heterodisulfide reductase iron-sulfur subunit A family protein [Candidatus Schekmanbacteria bacterium]|nr:CoB--CoM heterodisulfide reductase iron-sulfur subunit A family protein [Candidatus Schekmanbacteria bacterium]